MYERILVGFDASKTSEQGLIEALKIAGKTDATVRVVYVIEDYFPFMLSESDAHVLEEDWDRTAQGVLERAREIAADSGVPIDVRAIRTDARRPIGEALTEHANEWRADVIVLGTHGRSALKQILLGSVSERVVCTSDVPILLLRDRTQDIQDVKDG